MIANKRSEEKSEHAGDEREDTTPAGFPEFDADAEMDDLPEREPFIADVERLEEDVQDNTDDDDDNPYQGSDEALPDDDEEAAIKRDLAERGLTGE